MQPTWIPFYSGLTAQNYFLSLVCLLIIRAVVLLVALYVSGIGLGPEEAQYWLWSQHPDFGYYSKPLGIAWEIFTGTFFFGDTVLGVRAGAFFLGFLLPLAVYFLAICCGLKPATAFWSAAIMALSPLGILSAFLATSDVGYVLFWTLACSGIALALRRGETPDYRLIGGALALGALFKWPIYLFWPLLLSFSLLAARLRSWRMVEGIGISLLGLVPSLIWNMLHQGVTFRHVFSTLALGKGNFFSFFGAQFALFSPIFFGLLLWTFFLFLKRRRKLGLPLFFCGYITFVSLGVYLLLSLFFKMQGNWGVFVYPTAAVLTSWYACEWRQGGKNILFWGSVLSIGLTVLAFSIPTIQSSGVLASFPIPYRLNPFRPNVGWESLEMHLKEDGYDPEQHFLVSDRYQTSSLLSFYTEGQKRPYVLNLPAARKNQFSIWPSLADEQIGHDGFFVYIDEHSSNPEEQNARIAFCQEQLGDYFHHVAHVGTHSLFHSYDQAVKSALVFRCDAYNGALPADRNLY